jgi:hypothetical protein
MPTVHFRRSCGEAGREATRKSYIFCTGPCGEEKHESAFPPERKLQMRKNGAYQHAVCSVCMKLRSVSVSKAIEASKKLYICKNCGQSRKGSEYENVTLRYHILSDTLYDVVCLHCDASQFSRCTKDVYRCGTCQKMLPAVEFSVQRRKSHQDAKSLKCGMCERPPCFSCGARPEKPLTNQNEVVKSLKDRAKYRCIRCKYPPCAKCGMKDPTLLYKSGCSIA